MADRSTRRRFLAAGIAGCLASLAGCSSWGPRRETTEASGATDPTTTADSTASSPTQGKGAPSTETSAPDNWGTVDVRGAIYLPARAFNFYQQWADYDREVIERDLGYATEVNLNAIRTWASIEHWQEDAEAHREAIEHFLSTAEGYDLDVLLGLFDFAGRDPTEERLQDTDPRTATGVRSPSSAVMRDRSRWGEPERYVRWFMDEFRDDDRLMAIEAMNEPGWQSHATRFAGAMFDAMVDERGSVPLTVGSTSMANNAEYHDWGSDALQFHYNFAESPAVYREMLRSNRSVADELDVPVWLSEWQRVRGATGFATEPPDDQKTPDYASLAPLIHESGFGNFFWSLMVQPAFVPAQRQYGILNGLFHEDGTVWSREDARAIAAMSGETDVSGLEQRREWPAWASAVEDGT
ncbi:glycoside hydrolase 5 family protein [Halorussus litoreus]|uniref:glycoside hydrolase n=1 Tax=Halorussus litoreus TaxID=1710536 RepID=UPI001E49218E|nr:glycoside hydrolase [Halorussus litoreus]